MTHDEMIAVIAAHRDGKVIELCERHSNTGTGWQLCKKPIWDFFHYDYRIKPEPRVIWVNEYDGTLGMNQYNSEENARRAADKHTARQVKFVEVLE